MSLFILAVLFEFLVSMDALQEKNMISLSILLIFQCAMIIYSSLLPSQLATAIQGTNADTDIVDKHVRNYSIVIPAVIGGCTIAMAWLIWRLYEEFGWNLYKALGADLKIKRMYLKVSLSNSAHPSRFGGLLQKKLTTAALTVSNLPFHSQVRLVPFPRLCVSTIVRFESRSALIFFSPRSSQHSNARPRQRHTHS